MHWVFLGIAAMFEVVFALSANAAKGFTHRWYTVQTFAAAGAISYAVTRLYRDVPLVDGAPLDRNHAAFSDPPVLPWRRAILPPTST